MSEQKQNIEITHNEGQKRFVITVDGEAAGFAQKARFMLGRDITDKLSKIQPLCFDREGKV